MYKCMECGRQYRAREIAEDPFVVMVQRPGDPSATPGIVCARRSAAAIEQDADPTAAMQRHPFSCYAKWARKAGDQVADVEDGDLKKLSEMAQVLSGQQP